MIACVVSCTTMSCERQVKTVWPGMLRPTSSGAGAEVAEQDAVRARTVESVLSDERVRKDVERVDVVEIGVLVALPLGAAPMDAAPEGRLEMLDRLGDDRVDHLLMKARIGLGGIETAADQDARIVEIDRLVVGLVRAVVVDDGDGVARDQIAHHRTGIELLVADVHRHLIAEELPGARIERIRLERTDDRPLDVGHTRA